MLCFVYICQCDITTFFFLLRKLTYSNVKIEGEKKKKHIVFLHYLSCFFFCFSFFTFSFLCSIQLDVTNIKCKLINQSRLYFVFFLCVYVFIISLCAKKKSFFSSKLIVFLCYILFFFFVNIYFVCQCFYVCVCVMGVK